MKRSAATTKPKSPQLELPYSTINVPEHVDTWDEYFLWLAAVASIKSKDPKCRVGAVIVSPDHVLLSTGFNGLARGVYDDEHILVDTDEKLKVICHAEHNAIMNAARIGVALHGATIYVTKFPCLACCNAIVQVGISRIYTHDESYWNDDPFDKDHSRKQSIIRQTKIKVDAPFHPEYAPHERINPKKKEPTRAVEVATGEKTG
jgi:dCMP deaminase